ncbi:hypothetical protein C1645_749515 [Glomus cerebriforme]|uniref:Uncharacterized protein n=1 Tax=Glomus cerebriforme TaxID=658196 RepID=A0A397TTQ9_9GLOM|nr:hypothetical protein C1645_749515 [Glomus cerebriforme]
MVLLDDSITNEHELSEDILVINIIFICRLQGRRAAKSHTEMLTEAMDGIGKIDL